MQLARTVSRNYAFLPSGILIVDPDSSLLAARAQLLNAANHYVAVSSEEVEESELCRTEVHVAILSQSLGRVTVEMLAQRIRLNWPSAFILLFGNVKVTVEDWLYDESIDAHCRPEDLLSILHLRQKESYVKSQNAPAKIGSVPFGLFGAGWMLLRSVAHESDPSKDTVPAPEKQPTGRDVPPGEHSYDAGVHPSSVTPAETMTTEKAFS